MIDFSTGMTAGSPLERLEAQRRAAVRHCVKVTGGTFLATAAVAAAIWLTFGERVDEWLVLVVMLPIVLTNLAYFVFGTNKFGGYRDGFKSHVIAPLVAKLDPRLTYDHESGVSGEDYGRSLMFLRNYACARFTSEDLIQGELGSVKVRLSEMHAQSRHTSHSKNGTRTYYKTIFRGLLIILDGGPKLPTPVVVLSGRTWLKRAYSMEARLPYAPLDDRAFTACFTAYGEASAVAQALTPARRAKLLQLAAQTKGGLRVSFVGGQVYVGVPMKNDLFEPPYWRSLTTFNQQLFVEQMRGVASLVASADQATRRSA